MKFLSHTRFSIFFGDQKTSFPPQGFYDVGSEEAFREVAQFRGAVEAMKLQYLMALKQVHGIAGRVFTKPEDFAMRPYEFEGDYLITSVPHAGLAVATADCLPIIIYDVHKHVVSAIHAGWRGSVAGIVEKVLSEMSQAFDTKPTDCSVYFGPAAGSCCYEVDAAFLKNIAPEYQQESIVRRGDAYFFDNLQYNCLQFKRLGVPAEKINTSAALCTICSPQFCSYRRDKERSRRHMTIVALNPI